MKTLADFKRALTVGRKLDTVYHCAFNGRDEKGLTIYKDEDKGIREVSKVQSNSFALKTTKQDGSIVDSWCNYPKSNEIVFNQDGSITILEEDGRYREEGRKCPVLTYKFID